jgi:hypothetical protein
MIFVLFIVPNYILNKAQPANIVTVFQDTVCILEL